MGSNGNPSKSIQSIIEPFLQQRLHDAKLYQPFGEIWPPGPVAEDRVTEEFNKFSSSNLPYNMQQLRPFTVLAYYMLKFATKLEESKPQDEDLLQNLKFDEKFIAYCGKPVMFNKQHDGKYAGVPYMGDIVLPTSAEQGAIHIATENPNIPNIQSVEFSKDRSCMYFVANKLVGFANLRLDADKIKDCSKRAQYYRLFTATARQEGNNFNNTTIARSLIDARILFSEEPRNQHDTRDRPYRVSVSTTDVKDKVVVIMGLLMDYRVDRYLLALAECLESSYDVTIYFCTTKVLPPGVQLHGIQEIPSKDYYPDKMTRQELYDLMVDGEAYKEMHGRCKERRLETFSFPISCAGNWHFAVTEIENVDWNSDTRCELTAPIPNFNTKHELSKKSIQIHRHKDSRKGLFAFADDALGENSAKIVQDLLDIYIEERASQLSRPPIPDRILTRNQKKNLWDMVTVFLSSVKDPVKRAHEQRELLALLHPPPYERPVKRRKVQAHALPSDHQFHPDNFHNNDEYEAQRSYRSSSDLIAPLNSSSRGEMHSSGIVHSLSGSSCATEEQDSNDDENLCFEFPPHLPNVSIFVTTMWTGCGFILDKTESEFYKVLVESDGFEPQSLPIKRIVDRKFEAQFIPLDSSRHIFSVIKANGEKMRVKEKWYPEIDPVKDIPYMALKLTNSLGIIEMRLEKSQACPYSIEIYGKTTAVWMTPRTKGNLYLFPFKLAAEGEYTIIVRADQAIRGAHTFFYAGRAHYEQDVVGQRVTVSFGQFWRKQFNLNPVVKNTVGEPMPWSYVNNGYELATIDINGKRNDLDIIQFFDGKHQINGAFFTFFQNIHVLITDMAYKKRAFLEPEISLDNSNEPHIIEHEESSFPNIYGAPKHYETTNVEITDRNEKCQTVMGDDEPLTDPEPEIPLPKDSTGNLQINRTDEMIQKVCRTLLDIIPKGSITHEQFRQALEFGEKACENIGSLLRVLRSEDVARPDVKFRMYNVDLDQNTSDNSKKDFVQNFLRPHGFTSLVSLTRSGKMMSGNWFIEFRLEDVSQEKKLLLKIPSSEFAGLVLQFYREKYEKVSDFPSISTVMDEETDLMKNAILCQNLDSISTKEKKTLWIHNTSLFEEMKKIYDFAEVAKKHQTICKEKIKTFKRKFQRKAIALL